MTGRPDPTVDDAGLWVAGRVRYIHWRADGQERGERDVPEEMPVAVTVNGQEYAVMLVTPADLEDFTLGFLLAEGLIAAEDEIAGIDVLRRPEGLISQVRLHGPASIAVRRERRLAGTSSCGLCGVESLQDAVRPMRSLPDGPSFSGTAVLRAMADLRSRQTHNARTGAMHAAAFADSEGRLLLVREDVGRHNALDKLIGAMLREKRSASGGFVLLSSRCSYELVQKAAAFGFRLMCTASAPTALAVRLASEANITLATQVREDSFYLVTGADRISEDARNG